MSKVKGLRVTVEGDMPSHVMTDIASAVRRTVLSEIAHLDIAPPLHEVRLTAADFGEDGHGDEPLDLGGLDGIWLRQDEGLPL
ncbi:hypothetical protein ACGFZP_16455 [Kitasatospora sp. NPDC048239]|uniref:hypothetical protein n=1 Tax=Kitasatospora sp. NPDC048239 TaxID=3364046 RepID=UPI00371320B0